MSATLESGIAADERSLSTKGVDKGRTSAPDEKDISLESMTWPELKRAAREVGVKLGAKKPQLIRRIREARAFEAELEKHRNSLAGRVESARDGLKGGFKKYVKQAKAFLTARPTGKKNDPKQERKMKLMIWGGGLAVGALFGFIAAII